MRSIAEGLIRTAQVLHWVKVTAGGASTLDGLALDALVEPVAVGLVPQVHLERSLRIWTHEIGTGSDAVLTANPLNSDGQHRTQPH